MDSHAPPSGGASPRGGAEVRERLSRTRVLIAGLEPWGVVAALELAAAGVGALHLLGDGLVTEDDLLAVRAFTGADFWGTPDGALGRTREGAAGDLLRRTSPGCEVSSEPLVAHAERPLPLHDRRWDLILTCVHADDFLAAQSVARFAHAARVPSLAARLDGLKAIIGPAVLPGETACWDCARLRCLANSREPAAEHALHASLLSERPRRRASLHLSPTAGLLGHALAHLAMGLLVDLRGSPLLGRLFVRDLVTMQASFHTVLPMPWCDVCGGARSEGISPEGFGVGLDTARDPSELRRMLAGVLDERTGIVQRLMLEAPSPTTFPEAPRTATATLSTFTDGRHAPHRCGGKPEVGAGKGVTALDALVRAVGEAVERYSAERYETKERLRASVAGMAAAARDFIAPDRLGLYEDRQYSDPHFRYVRLAESTPIDWVQGRWLDTGSPVYVPALPAFFNYHAPREEAFCQVTSNGLAAGATLADASMRAALELIERDAFILSWLARLPGRRVLVDDSVDPDTREVARQLAAQGARLELYLLDVGVGVPTVMSVGFGDGQRWPGATVAMAAHPSPRAAIRKAVLEQAHVGPYLKQQMLGDEVAIPERPEAVHSLMDHATYYFPPERAAALRFLGEGGTVRAAELAEPEAPPLEEVVARVRAAGLRIAVVDVTSPDLAATPFRVARAIGPDFQQIHFGQEVAHLGNPRLLARAAHGINPDPHPMA
jgi:ribosomal protein S12 methylthiotransferase accessory factor